jgi:KDEL-tailed cysteine endopeptidase
MSTQIKCLLIILATCLSATITLKCDATKSIADQVYDQYSSNTKTLFKVWHFVQQKSYDYNTIEGINKYRTFKANLKTINEHNASNSSYKKGLNHLSDMTGEEVRTFYNIKAITPTEMRANLRSLKAISLDDYNEDEREIRVPSVRATKHDLVDHSANMLPVRNQQNCGSCWAFTTQAVLEGCYQKWNVPLKEWFSTQQSVDCDANNGGCNGGWFSNAILYFQDSALTYESSYAYTATKGQCRYNANSNTKIRVVGLASYQRGYSNLADFDVLLKKGPVAVAVDANDNWYSYKSGIFNGQCSSGVNHAVTLIGYGKTDADECNEGGEYFVIRNSWGSGWGEKGMMRIKNDENNSFSCNVEKYAYQPTAFKDC